MCIFKFSGIEEVIKRANNTEFGLGAGIVSENAKEIQTLVDKIKAGTVFVNCYNVFNSLTPFGGFKDSGIGREMGEEGLNAYLEIKSVVMQKI
jgi:aldehyde dehydrogenase (NAD+)